MERVQRYRDYRARFFIPRKHRYNLRSRMPMRDVRIHIRLSQGLELCPMEYCVCEKEADGGAILRICHRIRQKSF